MEEMHVADRGKEFIAEGHGKDFSKASKRSGGEGVSSMMYRVARTSTHVSKQIHWTREMQ